MTRSSWLAGLVLILIAAPAARAQPYVGASFVADVVRGSGSSDQQGNSGEALGAALRVGTSLGERWGVELEFARSGDREWRPDVRILAGLTPDTLSLLGIDRNIATAIFPVPDISIRAQLSTLTPSIWWRQRVGDRVDLVYSAGASFTRTSMESRYEISPILPARGQVAPTAIYAQEFVDYRTGVAVGFDAAIAMTEHARLVPAIRMLAFGDSWVIRPSAGLQWRF
jgi:hypothetical protein